MFEYIENEKPDILGIVEHMKTSITNIPKISGYKRFFMKANLTGGSPSGGILVLVKECLKFRVSKLSQSRKFNTVFLTVSLDNSELILGFSYAKTDNYSQWNDDFYAYLSEQFATFPKSSRVVLLGDFNARLGGFVGDSKINNSCAKFLSFLTFHNFDLLNKVFAFGVPTYSKPGKTKNGTSIIDFALSCKNSGVNNFGVYPVPLGENAHTSHKIIEVKLRADLVIDQIETCPKQQIFERFKRLTDENLGEFAEQFESMLLDKHEEISGLLKKVRSQKTLFLHSEKSIRVVEATYSSFLQSLNQTKTKLLSFPKRSFEKKVNVNPRLKRLQRRLTETTFELENENLDIEVRDRLFQKHKKLILKKSKLVEALQAKKYERFLKKLEDLDFKNRTRRFWSEVASIRNSKTREGIGVVKNRDGEISKTREEFLDFWADFWEILYSGKSSCTSDFKPLAKYEFGQYDCSEINQEPSLKELKSVLKTIAKNKSPGLDRILVKEISALNLTETKNGLQIVHELILIFWHLEKVPSSLKTMILVPLLKNPDEDNADPNNFRPIALMSNLLKIYQSILNSRLSKKLEKELAFAETQFGFRPNRNIYDAHFVFNEVLKARSNLRGPRGGIIKKSSLYVAYLDIKKAFDSVSRTVLFRKLYNFGIRGKILRVIIDQFSGVRGICKIDDLFTREFDIASGVVQGSRLGPILFNIFINDLLVELKNSGLGVELNCGKIVSGIAYADDLALFAKNPSDLQKLISICENWSNKNGLNFAPAKCKVQIFNPKKHKKSKNRSRKFKFTLYKKKLESVPRFKYLGILIENSRNPFNEFISLQIEKAEKRLGVVRLLGFHKDGLKIKTAVKLYRLLIRPILEFAAQVVFYSKTQLTRLERFQTKALRSLLGLRFNVKTSVVRLLSGIEPVTSRLELLKLKYFHKVRSLPKTALLYEILDSHMGKISLANRFRICAGLKLSEDFVFSLGGFYGQIFSMFKSYNLQHEFQITTEQTKSEFGNFVKSRILEFINWILTRLPARLHKVKFLKVLPYPCCSKVALTQGFSPTVYYLRIRTEFRELFF